MESAVITALGAVIGYVGSEVATVDLFERLLWPQRFQHSLSASTSLKLALLMPMGGPMHGAALETLDGFRDHGLYRGMMEGDMLGTAFFAEQPGRVRYFHRTAEKKEARGAAKEVRNGFWLQVLRHVRASRWVEKMGADEEKVPVHVTTARMRARKRIFRLALDFHGQYTEPSETIPGVVEVSEAHSTPSMYLGIFVGELSTLVLVLALILWYSLGDPSSDLPDAWLIGYLCVPLFLRLVAAACSVRREGVVGCEVQDGHELKTGGRTDEHHWRNSKSLNGDMGRMASLSTTGIPNPQPFREILEIDCPSVGFILLSVPSPLTPAALQFFRHYGHPRRTSRLDRAREAANIFIIYIFVLYFPAGLFALSWMSDTSQIIWLGQQLYCVLVMHILRLCGWQHCARTEERVARELERGKVVALVGRRGWVSARMEVEEVGSVKAGKERVEVILDENGGLRGGSR